MDEDHSPFTPVHWNILLNADSLGLGCITQNHRMVWVGRDFTDHLVPTPLPWAVTPSNYSRLLKAPSNQALNTSRDRASIASLANLFQCLITLIINNLFLISNLNLLSFSLKP